MKIKLIALFTFLLFTLISCTKEEAAITPTIDSPVDFSVSKGSFVDRIKIIWDAPPKSENFEIYRADSINSDFLLIGTTSESSYTDTSAHVVMQKYYYKVRVYNSKSEFSDFTHYDYGFISSFDAPRLSQNLSYGTSNNYVSLSWSPINGSNKYYIYRSSDNSTYNLIDSTSSATYNDGTSITPGDTYYYKIKAANDLIGSSDFSNVDSAYIFQKYEFEKTFGAFTLASFTDFDSKGNLYVVDASAGKVVKFDQDFNFVKDFISIPGTTFRGIKFLQNDNLIIAESNKGKIGFFDSNGNLIKEKVVANTSILRQLTTDESKNIYVTDLVNEQIVKLNEQGEFVTQWSTSYLETYGAYSVFYFNNSILASSVNGHTLTFSNLEGQSYKSWEGINAACIAKDNNNNFYFACFNKIIKTNSAGKVLSIIGLDTLEQAHTVSVSPNGNLIVADEKYPTHMFIYKQVAD